MAKIRKIRRRVVIHSGQRLHEADRLSLTEAECVGTEWRAGISTARLGGCACLVAGSPRGGRPSKNPPEFRRDAVGLAPMRAVRGLP